MSHADSEAVSTPPASAEASPDSFAARLRDATKTVHREAERTGFIADLIRGRATPAGYATYLANLVPIYRVLEAELDRATSGPLLDPFAAPHLRRLPALTADLVALGAPDVPALPEAEAYSEAIRAAGRAGAGPLVAHAYARYLGDLSGGQILRPLLAKSLGLGPEALGFYVFAVDDVEAPKAAMRQALDTVAPASAEADALVAEAILAFRHNIAMSEAVARAAAAA